MALPGREYKNTCQVVVVPAHLLLAEETDDLMRLREGCRSRGFGGVDKDVVVEANDVEEDGFVVEEELGEEGEVLCIKLCTAF